MGLSTKVLIASLFGMVFWGSGASGGPAGPPQALRIVLPASPALPEEFAARELVKYLTAMGNAKPLIVRLPESGNIYLGSFPQGISAAEKESIQSELQGQDPDSFVLRSSGGHLVIYGNSPRAVLYGTYHYLEMLGARWYFPGPENEVIPQAAVKLDGYDLREVPSFRKRGIVPFSITPGFEDLVDFAAKTKLNTIGLHVHPALPVSSAVGLESAMGFVKPRGLTLQIEAHFFGEDFCPEDKGTLERERKRFADYLTQLPPDMHEFFLWPADEELPHCTSPEYRDYSVSDSVLWFSNEMARTLHQSRPQAKFAFLSYLNTWEPPKHVKPSQGVILEWAPMQQSFVHALDDPTSLSNTKFRNYFEAYLRIFGPANSQVLGYWLDDSLFSRLYFGKLPYNPEALKGDLTYYHRMGVPAITTFGIISGRDYFLSHASPAVFLYPHLLWDVGADPRQLVRRFCQDYFGSEAAVGVYDLLAEVDKMVYVDRHELQAERVNDAEFVDKVAKALRMAHDLLDSQSDPVKKARAAKLVSEVSSRFISPMQPHRGEHIH